MNYHISMDRILNNILARYVERMMQAEKEESK